MYSLTAESEAILRDSGWFPGRNFDISLWVDHLEKEGIHVHGAARLFLEEFGGLLVDVSGPGVDAARAPFELDPMLCEGEEDRFIGWGKRIGRELVPIGEFDMGRYFLGIDQNGEVYLVELWVASFGQMPLALENMIQGRKATMMNMIPTSSHWKLFGMA